MREVGGRKEKGNDIIIFSLKFKNLQIDRINKNKQRAQRKNRHNKWLN